MYSHLKFLMRESEMWGCYKCFASGTCKQAPCRYCGLTLLNWHRQDYQAPVWLISISNITTYYRGKKIAFSQGFTWLCHPHRSWQTSMPPRVFCVAYCLCQSELMRPVSVSQHTAAVIVPDCKYYRLCLSNVEDEMIKNNYNIFRLFCRLNCLL